MDEQTTIINIPAINQTLVVNRSFTCQIRHVGMVSDLIQRGIGKDFSKVIQQAIEAYYEACSLQES